MHAKICKFLTAWHGTTSCLHPFLDRERKAKASLAPDLRTAHFSRRGSLDAHYRVLQARTHVVYVTLLVSAPSFLPFNLIVPAAHSRVNLFPLRRPQAEWGGEAVSIERAKKKWEVSSHLLSKDLSVAGFLSLICSRWRPLRGKRPLPWSHDQHTHGPPWYK